MVCVGECHDNCRISDRNHFKFGMYDPWPMAPIEFVGHQNLTSGSDNLLCNSGQHAALSKSTLSRAMRNMMLRFFSSALPDMSAFEGVFLPFHLTVIEHPH
jgi:hypothetical protein